MRFILTLVLTPLILVAIAYLLMIRFLIRDCFGRHPVMFATLFYTMLFVEIWRAFK